MRALPRDLHRRCEPRRDSRRKPPARRRRRPEMLVPRRGPASRPQRKSPSGWLPQLRRNCVERLLARCTCQNWPPAAITSHGRIGLQQRLACRGQAGVGRASGASGGAESPIFLPLLTTSNEIGSSVHSHPRSGVGLFLCAPPLSLPAPPCIAILKDIASLRSPDRR